MSQYEWQEPEPIPGLAADMTYPALVLEILARRGLRDPAQIAGFLDPRLTDLSSPFALPDMELAVARIRDALRSDAPIAVFGDYDVDGLTSTAALARTLRALGGKVTPYIPHRINDGYGLSRAWVRRIVDDGNQLLIAVDCGTGRAEELAMAHQAGLRTVVVDHHHAGAGSLPGTAFVSSRRPDSAYPFPELAAVGLVYQLIRAIAGDERAEAMLPLVALGTVADVVPLTGENRILVHHGLRRFLADAPVGLRALAEQADVRPDTLRSWHFAFVLGPRINAAGRMDDPRLALELLLADDWRAARDLAARLGRLNSERQQATRRLIADADALLALDGVEPPPVLLVAGEGWNLGLVGLAAGRLTERYARPSVVLAREGAISRGSARSIEGFDIARAFHDCRDLLLEHGGHSRAAGLTIESDRIDALRERLRELARRTFGPRMPRPLLRLDAELTSEHLTLASLRALSILEPFGQDHPSPVFLLRGVRVHGQQWSRDGKHLRFTVVCPDGSRHKAVFFNGGGELHAAAGSPVVDLAVKLKHDVWRGEERLTLEVIDSRPSAVPAPATARRASGQPG